MILTAITPFGEAAKAALEYGYPLLLSIVLIWYVYRQNNKAEKKNDEREKTSLDRHDAREKRSAEREDKYIGIIDALRDDIKTEAIQANNLAGALCEDYDQLHEKLTGLKTDVDVVKTGVCEIKTGVSDIKSTVEKIHEKLKS